MVQSRYRGTMFSDAIQSRCSVELGGARTLVIVPMLKDSELIGSFDSTARKCGPSPTSKLR